MMNILQEQEGTIMKKEDLTDLHSNGIIQKRCEAAEQGGARLNGEREQAWK
jgi:hypothetical protein